MSEENVIAASKFWHLNPAHFIKLPNKDVTDVRITMLPPKEARMTYGADGTATFETKDEHGEIETRALATADIKSIKLESSSEFYSGSRSITVKVLSKSAADTALFCQRLGISKTDIEVNLRAKTMFVMALTMLAVVVFMSVADPIIDFLFNALSFMEPDAGWIAVSMCGVVGFLACIASWKIIPSPAGTISFYTESEWYVSFYLNNGERFIASNTYQNKGQSLIMHADHQRAFDAASASPSDGQQAEVRQA